MVFLLHNSQLRIIQHDLLLAILLKLYCSYGVMRTTFYLYYFAKAKLLMLYSLPRLQTAGITWRKVRRGNMINCLRFGGSRHIRWLAAFRLTLRCWSHAAVHPLKS